ncbi:DUF7313 family protein [Haloarcula nitratireducens]|uniref:DUF7313 domain-containing protein n=1 Tax=Haloarcula nitratireducens TaxID=2487749 RepID=A0AAW4P7X6_9EURY|nr:hypothetical protein [Halomicroarcula nitratireducens]MBX0293872.1 hypothetical protein [Halomicroarcula nitratireducens]
MQPSAPLFGPLDAVMGSTGPGGALVIEYVLLVLVLANFATRLLAHRRYTSEYDDEGAEGIDRYPIHVASNVVLILTSFYYTTLAQHGGVVMSVLVLGLVITDFFEFESRLVEARRELRLERPKGAMVAALLLFMYAAYQSVFWIIKGPWSAII